MEREEQLKLARQPLESGVFSEESAKAIKADFPELAESEDERIRKELLSFIESVQHSYLCATDRRKKWIAYLEKQKVQPTDTKTEQVIKAARRVLNNWLDDTACPDVSGDFAELEYAIREYDGEEEQKEQKGSLRVIKDASEWEKIKEQKPAEWSEEDVIMLNSIITTCQLAAQVRGSGPAKHLFEMQERFLKSLRPRPHWKPSEEQMEALYTAAREAPIIKENGNYLYDLYDDLKKL